MKHSLPLKIAAIAWWLFGLPLMLAPNWLMGTTEPLNSKGQASTTRCCLAARSSPLE